MSGLTDYASNTYAITPTEFHSLPAERKLLIAQEWVDREWLYGVRSGVCESIVRDIEEQRPEHHTDPLPHSHGGYTVEAYDEGGFRMSLSNWVFALGGFLALCACLGMVVLGWMILSAIGRVLGVTG
jgi:hypothetical protein